MSEGGGLLARVRGFAAALWGLSRTRLALACVEIEEERLRLADLLLWAIVTLFCLAMGIVLAAGLVVLLLWNGPREWVLAGLTVAFLAAAAGCGWVWRHKSRVRPPLLEGTLAELRSDAAALSQRSS